MRITTEAFQTWSQHLQLRPETVRHRFIQILQSLI